MFARGLCFSVSADYAEDGALSFTARAGDGHSQAKLFYSTGTM